MNRLAVMTRPLIIDARKPIARILSAIPVCQVIDLNPIADLIRSSIRTVSA
jgi:hypothetical protein